jgi:hypothetical protein
MLWLAEDRKPSLKNSSFSPKMEFLIWQYFAKSQNTPSYRVFQTKQLLCVEISMFYKKQCRKIQNYVFDLRLDFWKYYQLATFGPL